MEKDKKIRQSNFELMRIISMFGIILGNDHGNVIVNCERDSLRLIFEFIRFLIIVHVNSYVLLTGYFQCKSKFRMSKLFKNINMMWFYRVVLLIFLVVINVWHPTHIEIFRNVFPLDLGFYWFLDVYILLYCVSPIINKYIGKANKHELRKAIGILFIIFSILPYITGLKTLYNDGYSLYNFVLLYLIGAYLRKYPLKECYLFKNISKNLFQIICIFTFFGCAVFNFLLTQFGSSVTSFGDLFHEMGSNVITTSLAYSNPFVIIQTIAYFCFFETLSFKSPFVNKLSSCTLGVYLIHNNIQIRHNIYKWLKIDHGPIYSYKFIFYVFAIAILIYIVCSIIERFRQVLFKVIYKRKLCCKWRQKYRGFIDNCGFNINW